MRTYNKQLSFLPVVHEDLSTAKRMKVADAAYIAGLIDGEGCISAYTRKANRHRSPAVRVDITNTHLATLLWVQSVTGVGTIGERKLGPRMRKPCYAWICVARKAAEVLTQVGPYLRIKRSNAEAALALQSLISTKGVQRQGQKRGALLITEAQVQERQRIADMVNDRRYLN